METTNTRIARLLKEKREAIEACLTELAINFDCPAPQILRVHLAKMNISRMDWERLTSLRLGVEFTAPPAHIAARW